MLHGLNSITSTIETSTDGGQSWTVGATLAARSLIAGSPNLYLLTFIHNPSVGTLIGIAVDGAVWLKTPTENWTQTGTVTGPADAFVFGSTTTPILLVSDQAGLTISHDLGTTWQLAVSR